MDSKNSGTSDPHRQLLNLTDKINLKSSDKYVDLPKLSIYYTWKNIKESYKNNQLKILALYQDYFEYILKNIEKKLIILQ